MKRIIIIALAAIFIFTSAGIAFQPKVFSEDNIMVISDDVDSNDQEWDLSIEIEYEQIDKDKVFDLVKQILNNHSKAIKVKVSARLFGRDQ